MLLHHSMAVFLFKTSRRNSYPMLHLCLKVSHHYRQCLCPSICNHLHLTGKFGLHSSACESIGTCVPGHVEAWDCFFYCSLLLFMRRCLLLTLELTNPARLMANQLHDVSCLCLDSAEITGVHHHARFYMCALGI